MAFRADLPTFAGGEIGDDLASRFDTAKYKTALRKARNMLALVGGGVYMRPGMEYAAELHDSSQAGRLIPFQFSLEQGYALVFADQRMNVIYDGGSVLDNELIVTNITNAVNARVTAPNHGWLLGDDVYFTGIEGMVEINGMTARINGVIDADTVRLNLNTSGFGVFTGATGGVAGNVLGGTGGHPPPVPPPAVGVPVVPVPPYVPIVIPPGTIRYGGIGDFR